MTDPIVTRLAEGVPDNEILQVRDEVRQLCGEMRSLTNGELAHELAALVIELTRERDKWINRCTDLTLQISRGDE